MRSHDVYLSPALEMVPKTFDDTLTILSLNPFRKTGKAHLKVTQCQFFSEQSLYTVDPDLSQPVLAMGVGVGGRWGWGGIGVGLFPGQ